MIDQHSSLAEKFLKKGFWLYLFSFIIAPIGYIIKIIISHELSVSEVGILYGVLSLVVLLSSFNDFGMMQSLNYFIPKYVIEKRYDKVKSIITYAFLTQVITGIIIALFLFFGSSFLSKYYFESDISKSIIKIFALYFLGVNIFQVFNGFFLVIQNTFYSKVNDFLRISFVLFSVLSIFMFDLGNIITYSFSRILGLYFGIISVVYLFYTRYYKIYLKQEKIIWSKKMLKTVFSYAIIIFIGAQAGTILSQIDMQMIIYILGTKDAGYYTNYLSIISIPFMLLGPIMGLLFPIFSEMNAKKEYNKIKIVKQIFQKNFISIVIFFNILFFVFAEIIAFILFGEKFIQSGIILRYSILFLVFNFLLQINFNILAGIGEVKERTKIILKAIVLNTILNLIFINLIGVGGAALATGIGWVFIWILSEISLGKRYSSSFDFISFVKNIFSMFILGILSYIFVVPIFDGLGRVKGFGFMFFIGIIWSLAFLLVNINEFKFFILEVKKLKKL